MDSQSLMGSPNGSPDLPGEIRNMVYRYLLRAGNDINISRLVKEWLRNHKQRSPQHMGLQLAILRVNRQICSEATGIFYRENIFIAEEHDDSFEIRHVHYRMGLPHDSYGVPHPVSKNLVRARLRSAVHWVKNLKVLINLSEPVDDDATELTAKVV